MGLGRLSRRDLEGQFDQVPFEFKDPSNGGNLKTRFWDFVNDPKVLNSTNFADHIRETGVHIQFVGPQIFSTQSRFFLCLVPALDNWMSVMMSLLSPLLLYYFKEDICGVLSTVRALWCFGWSLWDFVWCIYQLQSVFILKVQIYFVISALFV